MNRLGFVFAVVLAICTIGTTAFAQGEPVLPRAHPALWQIDRANSRVYLFGSLHILPATLDWVDSSIAAAMAASDDFVFEVPVDDDAIVREKAFIVQYGLLPPSVALHDLLTPREFYTYASVLMQSGLPKVQFDHYRPWLASLVLGLAYLHRDITNLRGADDVLLDYAQSHDKGVLYLESIDDQMKLLIGGNDKAQLAGLQSVISALPQERAHQQQLLDAWSTGDSDRLAQIIDGFFHGHEQAREFLLGARNRNWLAHLDGFLSSGKTTFVTVGAAHLSGPSGLLQGLCARGYAVTRVGSDGRPGASVCEPRS